MLAAIEGGVGCMYMPSPRSEPVPVVKLDDTAFDVISKYYIEWKQEQANKKRYGG